MQNSISQIENLEDLQKYIEKIIQALQSQEFFDYLSKKSRAVVDLVSSQNLNADEEQQYSHIYRVNHEVSVNMDEIVISNEVMIPVSAINPNIAMNYPNGFDLAKAIEYGTGIVGAGSDASELATERGWQYMVNTERDYTKPWFYKDENGNLRWTRGMSGKLIYYKSKQMIEEQLEDWINEYIENL